MYIFQTLRPSDTGFEVRFLQRSLPHWCWENPVSMSDVDGVYGDRTKQAVWSYQAENGLTEDGIAGPKTLSHLGIWADVIEGIDVSDYQPSIDWSKVEGIDFGYIKASEGITWQAKYLDYHYQGACRQGLKVGVYHFARMGTNAPWQELDNLQRTIEGKHLSLPVAIDLEIDFQLPPEEALDWALAWLDKAKRVLPQEPIVYTGPNTIKHRLNGGAGLDQYRVWWPRWSTQPVNVSPWREWSIWQYTNRGSIPGFSGNVDRNYLVAADFAK